MFFNISTTPALCCTLLIFFLSTSPDIAQAQNPVNAAVNAPVSADEILRRADEVRCPPDSFYMEVEIETKREKELTKLEVFTRGRDKTRINTLLPARDRKRSMIMSGDEMWVYVPNLKRSVLVSLSQKMSGETAIGDVSRMRWWKDYTPAIESEDEKHWILKLTAARKGLTYEKISSKIEKQTYRPVSAEYRSRSGLLIKTSRFTEYKKIADEIRPTVIHFDDARVSSKSSVLRILKIEKRESPDAFFDPMKMQASFK